MSSRTLLDRIDSYGRGYEALVGAIEQFPSSMWQYRPEPSEWTIHEIIIHLADSEANSYVRCRRFLAEPGQPLMAYDENQWARGLDYHSQSTEDALELFRWLRKRSFDLIRKAPAEAWAWECYHPENGLMTLEDWLDTYERHVPEHIAQMDAVYQRWLAEQDSG